MMKISFPVSDIRLTDSLMAISIMVKVSVNSGLAHGKISVYSQRCMIILSPYVSSCVNDRW
jgi:hypothetical protein